MVEQVQLSRQLGEKGDWSQGWFSHGGLERHKDLCLLRHLWLYERLGPHG